MIKNLLLQQVYSCEFNAYIVHQTTDRLNHLSISSKRGKVESLGEKRLGQFTHTRNPNGCDPFSLKSPAS